MPEIQHAVKFTELTQVPSEPKRKSFMGSRKTLGVA